MDNMGGIFGFIGIASGAYVLYAWYQMKTMKEINRTILLPKTVDPKKCKDKEAYMKEASPKMLVLAAAAIVYGVTDTMKVTGVPLWTALLILFAVLIWFGVSTAKMNKKYF